METFRDHSKFRDCGEFFWAFCKFLHIWKREEFRTHSTITPVTRRSAKSKSESHDAEWNRASQPSPSDYLRQSRWRNGIHRPAEQPGFVGSHKDVILEGGVQLCQKWRQPARDVERARMERGERRVDTELQTLSENFAYVPFLAHVRGHSHMMPAKFLGFWTPSPPCPCPHLVLKYSIEFTQPPLLRLLFHDPPPPYDADIISGSSLN